MASKSLTHIFMIMRDKAFQRRNMYQMDEGYGDQELLVSRECRATGACTRLPDWTSLAEEVRYNTHTLHTKTKRLHTLQSNLVRQPSLEDNSPEEQQLSVLSNEITKVLERCRSMVLQLSHITCSGREEHLKSSVVRALLLSLTELHTGYSASCAAYTNSMSIMKQTSSVNTTALLPYEEEERQQQEDTGWRDDQQQFLSTNHSAVIADREKTVQGILRSTLHLNQLFRDVAHLVHEQGSVVDRIDSNIETASMKVQEGSQQLRKAHKHQKKNRNLMCILCLASTIVILILILVVLKS